MGIPTPGRAHTTEWIAIRDLSSRRERRKGNRLTRYDRSIANLPPATAGSRADLTVHDERVTHWFHSARLAATMGPATQN